MRIGMISYDMQDFGGLEEYAVNLAVGLKQLGHAVTYLSAEWVHPNNQYARRLKAHQIPLYQPPKWISRPASNWVAKERLLRAVMWIFSPLVLVMGIALSIVKLRSPISAIISAHNFLKGQLMDRVIGRDYRKVIGRVLLTWWKSRWKPDILHIHGYTISLLFAIEWAHARNFPVVYEEHQTPDPQFNWWQGFEHTINLANRVMAVSEKSAVGLREVCKVTRPIVVHGPLLSDPFDGKWQKDYREPTTRPFMITTVARLYVTKGLTYLLDTAALVKQKYPNVEFKVYGEGELRDELLAKAERLGLDGASIFPGAFASREELTRIMTNTDIFLLSSILEGQPLVIVEAMAYGCPIVTTNVGGIPELIQDDVNGLMCPPEEPECLAEKIMTLIESESMRAKLGNAARAYYVQSPFEAQTAAKFFLAVFSEVLAERNMPGLLKQ